MRAIATVFVVMAFCGCDKSPSVTEVTEPEYAELITKVDLINAEIQQIGLPPAYRRIDAIGQEHSEHAQKLRVLGFLEEWTSLNELISEYADENRTLPPKFFSGKTWVIYDSLVFAFFVSKHEGKEGESAYALAVIDRFLALQKHANVDEEWGQMLAFRTKFVETCTYIPDLSHQETEVFNKQHELFESRMPYFWDSQILDVFGWDQHDIEYEKSFVIALLLEVRSLSEPDAQAYYYELIERTKPDFTSIAPQVTVPRWLQLMRSKVENPKALARCIRFSYFTGVLEYSHVSCCFYKFILDSRDKHLDFGAWSNGLYATISSEYPNAFMSFEEDPDNPGNCIVRVLLYKIGETFSASVKCPEYAFDSIPVSFGQNR